MNNNVKLGATIKRQKIILYTTLQILGIVAILLVGSSFDWLNMKFDINLVKTWNYWKHRGSISAQSEGNRLRF